jgi:hypothetical protein
MKSAIYLVLMLAAALTLGFAIRGILGNTAVDVPESLVLGDDTAAPLPREQPAERLDRLPDGTIYYLFQNSPAESDTKPEFAAPCKATTLGCKQRPSNVLAIENAIAASLQEMEDRMTEISEARLLIEARPTSLPPMREPVERAVLWEPPKRRLVGENRQDVRFKEVRQAVAEIDVKERAQLEFIKGAACNPFGDR